MISQQNELLCQVRSLLADIGSYNELLLENFFYCLAPVIMRNVLRPQPLKSLFLMLLEALNEGIFMSGQSLVKAREEDGYLLVMVACDSASLKSKVAAALAPFGIVATDLATTFVTVYDNPCLGYIYRCEDPQQRHRVLETITHAVEPVLAATE